MKHHRMERVNSLLKQVIFDVIHREVKNPHITSFVTVTRVETSPDLSTAKVYISLLVADAEKSKIITALQSAAGFIAIKAHKQMDRLRFFPSLLFRLDTGVEESIRIQEILSKIEHERNSSS